MSNTEKELLQQARIPADNWWPLRLATGHKSPEWTTWMDEQLSWKHGVSIWTTGVQPFFEIAGPDATRLMEDTYVNNFSRAKPGTVKNVIACREDGKIIADTMCLVMGENRYEISITTSAFLYTMDKRHYDVTITPKPPRTTIQVSGPKSFDLLQTLTDLNLEEIKFAHFNLEPAKFAGYDAYLVRLTMSGELGFEIQAPGEVHDELYSKIVEAGKPFGIRRTSVKNHLVQHMEAGLVGQYGDTVQAYAEPGDPYMEFLRKINDITVMLGIAIPKISGSFEAESFADYYASPVDLGLSRIISLDHDFPGRAALEEEMRHPKRKMVALRWNKEDVVDVYASLFTDSTEPGEVDTPHFDFMELPRDPKLPVEASKVLVAGKQVAFTTSRTYSYAYRAMFSNCMMPIEYAEPGTEVTIVWGNPGHPQKNIRAVVVEHPIKPNHTKDR